MTKQKTTIATRIPDDDEEMTAMKRAMITKEESDPKNDHGDGVIRIVVVEKSIGVLVPAVALPLVLIPRMMLGGGGRRLYRF